MEEKYNARELALVMLLEVTEDGKFCNNVIAGWLAKNKDMEKKERAFASTLCLGCIERKITLDYYIGLYSKLPVEKLRPVIRAILRMGFYQMLYLGTPHSAICNEAVKLAKKRGHSGLSGFINGVLRNASRNLMAKQEQVQKRNTKERLSILYSMPEWLTERFLAWYGEESTEEMFRNFLEKPDLTVRVNAGNIGIEECIRELEKEGVTVSGKAYAKGALHLAEIDSLERLAAFRNGHIQAQDESSMLAVQCAGIKAGDYVIDCCAAPGGKTVHAADILVKEERLLTVREELSFKGKEEKFQTVCEELSFKGKEEKFQTVCEELSFKGKEEKFQTVCEELSHIETENAKRDGIISARDISEEKLRKIRENVKRAGYENVQILLADALVLRQEDIGSADVVIADLPCSGLGIIGRKPDIKYNVTAESLVELAQLQRKILSVVSQYVKPGGTLIFSTCTMNPEENGKNADWIQEELGMIPESLNAFLPEELHSKDTERGRLQLMPAAKKTDGFFISRFRKPDD